MAVTCDQCLQQIDLHLDGQLDRESTAVLKEHLACCSRCRKRFEYRQALILRLRRAGRKVQVPPSLLDRINARPSFWSRYRRLLRRGAAAALVVLLPALAWFYMSRDSAAGRLATLEGTLVCMGKKLEERYSVHRDCGNYGHLPVLETGSGEVWHMVNNGMAHELSQGMDDESRPRIRVVAYVFSKEHFLEVQSYRRLPDLDD